MWVFLNNSFLSIVEDYDDRNRLMVRARKKGDIEAVFPKAHVLENHGTDYKFRAFVDRVEVATAMFQSVWNIDYHNFKDSINKKDVNRKKAYMNVWNDMWAFQEEHDIDENFYGLYRGR